MTRVLIKNGQYKGVQLDGMEFQLSKGYSPMTKAIMIWADERIVRRELLPKKCHVKIAEGDFTILHGDQDVESLEFRQSESEEDAMNRVRTAFDHLEQFSQAVVEGNIGGLIVVGPPGVGKTTTVEGVIAKSRVANYEFIGGSLSGIVMYQKLWEYRNKGELIILDDCEFEDKEIFNLLKKALDSTQTRVVGWHKMSPILNELNIPSNFEYDGSVIFLTNVDMLNRKGISGKHLDAIVSRCYYLDMDLETRRDQLIRIKQMINDGMLAQHGLTSSEACEILTFIDVNQDDLQELSLRMAVKLAKLKRAYPSTWQGLATSSCMKKAAKYKRLLKT